MSAQSTHVYCVMVGMPGYLPDGEPTYHETLESAKDTLRFERESYLDAEYGFTVLSPLKSITRTALIRYGELAYGEAGNGYRVYISRIERQYAIFEE